MSRSNNAQADYAKKAMLDLQSFPQEHIPTVLNSIVCEALLNFQRELVNGQWAWTGTGVDGQQINELFDIVHNDPLALDFLTRFCDQQDPPYGYQVNRVPAIKGFSKVPMFSVYLLAPDLKTGQPNIVAKVDANRLGVGVALALCYVVDADLQTQHRTLFPGHYMALNS